MDRPEFDAQLLSILPDLEGWCSYLCKRNKENTQELLQRTVLTALEKHDVCDPVFVKSWLFGIALRKAWVRETEAQRIIYYNHLELYYTGVTTQSIEIDLKHIYNAIDHLPEKWKTIIQLHMVGYSHTEIASIMKTSPVSLKSKICKARRRLRQSINC